MPDTVCIYADCACVYGTPTYLGVGIYTEVNKQYVEACSGYRYIGTGTVPEGEFKALYFALSVAVKMYAVNPDLRFKIFQDAQAIVNIFNGVFKYNKKFANIYHRTKMLQDQLGDSFISLTWIRRECNTEADKLSKLAIADYKPTKK